MGDAGDQTLGGLIGLDRGLDRLRGDPTIDGVVARAVQAGGLELDGALGERWQSRRTVEGQRRRDPGNRRADHCLADVKVTQIDLHRQVERSAAGTAVLSIFRQAAEIQMVCLKLIDLRNSVDQFHRRPVENQAMNDDVRPLGVRHLDLLRAQRVGKAPG